MFNYGKTFMQVEIVNNDFYPIINFRIKILSLELSFKK